MNIISLYRSTVHSFLGSAHNKIIMTNKYGIQLIRNIFNPKELLDMNVSGTCLVDDLIPPENCEGYDIVIFVEDIDVDIVLKILEKYDNKLYIYFYTPITRETLDALILNDKKYIILDLAYCPLNFIPISPHCAIGCQVDIFSIMRSVPKSIYGLDQDVSFSNKIIQKCENMTTLYSSPNDSLALLVLNRDYDKLAPLLIPWHYESMLHYHNIKLEFNGFGDELYERIRYQPYDFASQEIRNVAKALKSPDKTNVIEIVNYKRKSKLITQHLNALSRLDKYLKDNSIFDISEMQQKALLRMVGKNDLKTNDIRTIDAIYSSNKFSIQDGSIYMQYVPKIISIAEDIIKGRKINGITDRQIKHASHIYIYVREFISYEEIASIEIINKKYEHNNIKFFLISDSILGYWHYLPITHDDTQITTATFRVNRLTQHFCEKRNAIILEGGNRSSPKIYKINDIEINLNKLKEYLKIDFDSDPDDNGHDIIDKISMLLNEEYIKIKAIIPNNPLEENDKKIDIIKLNQIATEFKSLVNKHNKIYGKRQQTNDIHYDQQNDTTVLLQQKQEYIELKNHYISLLNTRDEQLRELTDGVLELQQIFLDLQILVHSQDELIDVIETNIIKADDFVGRAVIELNKAKSHSKTGSKIMTVIAGVVGTAALTIGLSLGLKFS